MLCHVCILLWLDDSVVAERLFTLACLGSRGEEREERDESADDRQREQVTEEVAAQLAGHLEEQVVGGGSLGGVAHPDDQRHGDQHDHREDRPEVGALLRAAQVHEDAAQGGAQQQGHQGADQQGDDQGNDIGGDLIHGSVSK